MEISKLLRTFAPMRDLGYIITGINTLTGEREAISHAMPKDQAINRLEREKINRRHQRYQAHKCLRIEQVQPVQTTLKFEDYE